MKLILTSPAAIQDVRIIEITVLLIALYLAEYKSGSSRRSHEFHRVNKRVVPIRKMNPYAEKEKRSKANLKRKISPTKPVQIAKKPQRLNEIHIDNHQNQLDSHIISDSDISDSDDDLSVPKSFTKRNTNLTQPASVGEFLELEEQNVSSNHNQPHLVDQAHSDNHYHSAGQVSTQNFFQKFLPKKDFQSRTIYNRTKKIVNEWETVSV